MTTDQNNALDQAFLDMLGKLSRLVRVALGNPANFNARWDVVVSALVAWLRGLPAVVSPLSRNLELLRRVENEFGALSLKRDEAVFDLLLSGAAKPGEKVTIRGQSWLVVSRAVSANYGVEYSLVNAKGEQLRHEFFD